MSEFVYGVRPQSFWPNVFARTYVAVSTSRHRCPYYNIIMKIGDFRQMGRDIIKNRLLKKMCEIL